MSLYMAIKQSFVVFFWGGASAQLGCRRGCSAKKVWEPLVWYNIRTAIEEEWTNIPKTTINNLINYQTPRPPNEAKLHISVWPLIL